ncbi:probable long-chain-alcohol O-fatty-acyltransferase 5 [Gossypium hirsutum]|uniref:Probable long-chain-alcohol O-fatty-acyltransferase 5 n=1 Tax=Gossypium hirsutum TaxID=3635 RepID=A0ABM3A1N2_GOSHI|nr:probable long-chain-alcohol O-fatty-acyltransferase 5 [Gossypium hirsutum]
MENELHNFIKVWILAIISLCYCFYISSKLPKGIFKPFSLTPTIIFFLYLPLTVSSVHLVGITAFFLSWLANFKLLLFCFDQPPLSPPPSNLFHFISIGTHPFLASLPIKLQQKTSSQNKSKPPQRSILFAIKVLILALLYHCYNYKRNLHKNVVLAMYGVHMYIELELTLALAAIPARAMFGLEIEPQFNEPFLTTSLQDFWGRRWNLIVTSILRPIVYYPMRRISTRLVGSRWTSLPAIITVFVVSGLMHELMYYYVTRVAPTWEMTWFFILHGVAVAAEVVVKKVVPEKMRLHPVVSGALAMGFLAVTAVWLFLPQLLRNGVDEKAIGEYCKLMDLLKGLLTF